MSKTSNAKQPLKGRSIKPARITEPTELQKLLTIQEAAEITGESPWTWRARCYAGRVASVKLNGANSRLLIPASEITRLINEGMRPAIA